jgi:hypothetical protein
MRPVPCAICCRQETPVAAMIVSSASARTAGKSTELADAHGQFVVLRLEAERAGHAAAHGVNLDDVGTGDAAQQRHGGSRTSERLLVAVAVEQDAAAAEAILRRQDEPALGDGSRIRTCALGIERVAYSDYRATLGIFIRRQADPTTRGSTSEQLCHASCQIGRLASGL